MAMPLTCGNTAGVPFRILTPSVRDEEAAGSNPATPTIKLHVTDSFRNQSRLLARVGFRMRGASGSRARAVDGADQR